MTVKSKLIDNVRSIVGIEDTELRESLKEAGWDPELPAIKDENDRVLVGHRRLKIAAEEGIVPVIKTVIFGVGPDAEARRMRLAVVSNVGGAPITREERKSLAVHLYDEGKGLTIETIAGIIGVGKSTVARDLQGVFPSGKTSRPQGGRPKSVAKKPAPHKYSPAIERAAAASVLDDKVGVVKTAQQLGISEQVVIRSVEREKGRREVLADPEVKYEELSRTAQEKLHTAIRQEKQKLANQFDELFREHLQAHLDKTIIPDYYKKLHEAQAIIDSHKGVFTPNEFKAVWACLHPDSRKAATEKRFNEAFRVFAHHKKVLVKEVPAPSKHPAPPPLPATAKEWMALREKVRAERAAARAAKKNSAGTVSTQGGG